MLCGQKRAEKSRNREKRRRLCAEVSPFSPSLGLWALSAQRYLSLPGGREETLRRGISLSSREAQRPLRRDITLSSREAQRPLRRVTTLSLREAQRSLRRDGQGCTQGVQGVQGGGVQGGGVPREE